uniref:Putative ovule protein n=1 Tax=Solanum chacoense TaxID=4108 RepID=A0A0V0GRI9_SOLCH
MRKPCAVVTRYICWQGLIYLVGKIHIKSIAAHLVWRYCCELEFPSFIPCSLQLFFSNIFASSYIHTQKDTLSSSKFQPWTSWEL